MSLPGDELDVDERQTTLAVFEHQRLAAAERALLLDEVLAKLERALSDNANYADDADASDDADDADAAAARAQPTPTPDGDDGDPALRCRCYRAATTPLAALAGPITRSLADFLG